MSRNIPFRCKIGLKIETQWADIMSCVSELVLQTSRGCTTSVVPRGDPVFPHTSVWRVLHEQQLHPYHLQKGHALGLADFEQVHCVQRTIGSPRGTTLVVQPLEVCNTNSETQDISPLCFDLQTYFTSKWYVSGHGCLNKTLSTKSPLRPLEVCNTNSETQDT